MSDLEEAVQTAVEHGKESRFNSLIALIVSIAATFMALCNVKDGNIVQAMALAQARSIDQWAYYQAKGVKQNMQEALVSQLELQVQLLIEPSPQVLAQLERATNQAQLAAKNYEAEKLKIKQAAEGYEAEYERLNLHDDQFDAADASFSLAIALLGVAALTRKPLLLGLGMVFSGAGIVFGVAGFLELGLHPDFLARWLG
jgi:carbonic anhydrase/acetyltransferase-like protein (isoleucine patch superfamily)